MKLVSNHTLTYVNLKNNLIISVFEYFKYIYSYVDMGCILSPIEWLGQSYIELEISIIYAISKI